MINSDIYDALRLDGTFKNLKFEKKAVTHSASNALFGFEMFESLESDIEKARKREFNDDHLNDDKRASIVARYRKAHPGVKLPKDMTDAYVEIIFEGKLPAKADDTEATKKDLLESGYESYITKAKDYYQQKTSGVVATPEDIMGAVLAALKAEGKEVNDEVTAKVAKACGVDLVTKEDKTVNVDAAQKEVEKVETNEAKVDEAIPSEKVVATFTDEIPAKSLASQKGGRVEKDANGKFAVIVKEAVVNEDSRIKKDEFDIDLNAAIEYLNSLGHKVAKVPEGIDYVVSFNGELEFISAEGLIDMAKYAGNPEMDEAITKGQVVIKESSEESRSGLPAHVTVEEDENGKWFWENTESDQYRTNFATRSEAIKDALEHIKESKNIIRESRVDESLANQLDSIDKKLSGKSKHWDDAVEEAFNDYEVSNFEDLVKADKATAETLVRVYAGKNESKVNEDDMMQGGVGKQIKEISYKIARIVDQMKESLTPQAKQRMAGIVKIDDIRMFKMSAEDILKDLMKDGFDELEVKEYLSIIVNQMIVKDDANESKKVNEAIGEVSKLTDEQLFSLLDNLQSSKRNPDNRDADLADIARIKAELKRRGLTESKVNESFYTVPEEKKKIALSKLQNALDSNNVSGTPTVKILRSIISNLKKDNYVSPLDISSFEYFTGIKAEELIRESKVNEAASPLTADIQALDSTMSNVKNYFKAEDYTQAIQYLDLVAKQSADVKANLQTMKAAKDAADNVNNAPAPVSPNAETPVPAPIVNTSNADEGKLPAKADDSEDAKKALLEADNAKIEALAEKAFLVSMLKEQEALTESEKKFIEAVEKESMDESTRTKVIEACAAMKTKKMKKVEKKS